MGIKAFGRQTKEARAIRCLGLRWSNGGSGEEL